MKPLYILTGLILCATAALLAMIALPFIGAAVFLARAGVKVGAK